MKQRGFFKTAWVGLVLVLATRFSIAASLPKVHALFIFDTRAARIGASVEKDQDNLLRALRESFTAARISDRLVIRTLTGNQVTSANIYGWLSGLRHQTGPDGDVILLVYSGHGGNIPDRGHALTLANGENVYSSELRRAIQFQNARFAVFLKDACATTMQREVRSRVHVVYRAAPAGNHEVIADLLFQPTGFLEVGSTGPGQSALGNDEFGGFWTYHFAQLLSSGRAAFDTNRDSRVSWTEFLTVVNERLQPWIDVRFTQQPYVYPTQRMTLFTTRHLRLINDTVGTVRARVVPLTPRPGVTPLLLDLGTPMVRDLRAGASQLLTVRQNNLDVAPILQYAEMSGQGTEFHNNTQAWNARILELGNPQWQGYFSEERETQVFRFTQP